MRLLAVANNDGTNARITNRASLDRYVPELIDGVSEMGERYRSIKQDIAIAKRLADSVIRQEVLREDSGARCVDVLHHRALKAALLMAIFRLPESALVQELPRNLMFRWFLDLDGEESFSLPRLCVAWRHLRARGHARDFFERFARRAVDHGLVPREVSGLRLRRTSKVRAKGLIHLGQRGQQRASHRIAAEA